MRKLLMFNMISLDGYYEGPDHDISWHTVDSTFNDFAIEQLNSVDTLVFGKRTYELMVSYWPTEQGMKDDKAVAALMNATSKVVCSTSLKDATWNNTKVINTNVEQELERMKSKAGKDMIIFGSGTLCSSLRPGLIDEYRIIVSPLSLGAGTPLFRDRRNFILKSSRAFSNGNILLTYAPGA